MWHDAPRRNLPQSFLDAVPTRSVGPHWPHWPHWASGLGLHLQFKNCYYRPAVNGFDDLNYQTTWELIA